MLMCNVAVAFNLIMHARYLGKKRRHIAQLHRSGCATMI